MTSDQPHADRQPWRQSVTPEPDTEPTVEPDGPPVDEDTPE